MSAAVSPPGPAGATHLGNRPPPRRPAPAPSAPRRRDDALRYRPIRRIGAGGSAVVYEGLDQVTQERVALKVATAKTPPRLEANMMREAEIGARLAHPGLVRIRGFGRHRKRAWMAQDLVLGRPLSELSPTKSLTVAARLFLVAEVARTAQYLHEQGFLHRDIKASNVLVRPSGRPALIDLGLVTPIDDPSVPHEGGLGTPTCSAPEQLMGRRQDARTDVFSLGALLFELFGTRRPWEAESLVALVTRVCTRPAEDLAEHLRADLDSKVTKPLAELVAECLDRERQNRPSSAAIFAARVDGLRAVL